VELKHINIFATLTKLRYTIDTYGGPVLSKKLSSDNTRHLSLEFN